MFRFAFGGPGSGPGEINAPYHIAANSLNEIYVACESYGGQTNGRLEVFDNLAHYKTTIGQNILSGARALAFDNQNNIFISEGENAGRIVVLSSTGVLKPPLAVGVVDSPKSLALDNQGNIYVIDNYKILKLDAAGNITKTK